jgi:uncharacterized protein YjdB
MSFPSPITGLKLLVTTGTSPNLQTFEQPILPSELSGTTNSVLVTNSDLLNAFNSQPLGTTFTPSIVTTYEGFPSSNSLSTESSSPFVPRQTTTNLSFQNIPDLNALTAPFELIVSTNSPVARAPLSFSSSNSSVLSVSSSGLVTAQGSGTVTITASQEISSDNIYTAATFVSRVITVVKEIPTISNFTIPAKNFGDAPFTLSAPTSNSSGAFSYTSSNPSVATISGSTVTIVGDGTTIITATQAATNNYTSATTTASLVVSPITPTLGSFTIPAKNFGDAPFTLSAPTSNSSGSFSYTSSDESVATISGSTVTIIGGGSCTIFATQAATNNYNAKTVSAQFVVNKIAPTFGSFSVPPKNFGDAPFTLPVPDSDSDGAFTYTSSYESVATVNPTTGLVTIVGAGQTTITATQAATNIYTSATITSSLVVSQIVPTFGSFSVPPKNFGDAPFTLSAPTSNSSGAFTYTSSDESVATISGSTVTIVGTGETVITATQAATNNYTSATITDSLFVIAWVQRGLDIDGEAVDDLSGYSVSLSSDGNTVAIGAYSNDGNDGNSSNAGHVRIFNWNGTLWVKRGLDIDGEAAGDLSGYSVSLSSDGNTVAIGAPNNDGTGSNAGHVRVYDWNGTLWFKRGLDIDGEAPGDNSGSSVSLSSDGNTVAIGAYGNDGKGSLSGHVRVYNWNGTLWIQRGLDIDGEAAYDYSGYSVSLSSDGNTVAIGANANDGNGSGSYTGHVRVYDWNGTLWFKRGLDIDGEAPGDQSGYSVSLSSDGNTVAIGAPYNDGPGENAGHVRVYDWNGTLWVKRGLDIDGEAAYDQSGRSVSLSSDGNTVAIGAPYNSEARVYAGHVRVYNWNGTSWNQIGLDIDGEAVDDLSGYSVSLSSDGNTVAIGAYGNDANSNDGNRSYAGHVRVYTVVKEIPTVVKEIPTLSNFTVPPKNFGDVPFTLSAPTTNSGGAFTYTSSDESVATISGSTVTIVGGGTTTITATQAATNNYTSATITDSLVVGAVWVQRGLDIDGEAPGDYSGWSVSISSDGNTVAIGAIYNDGTGSNAGHVRVYKWDGSLWTQFGLDIDGEAGDPSGGWSPGDQSGWSVSLSSDGNTVAIGSTNNNDAGSYTGHVRVYDWNAVSVSWAKRGLDIDGEAAFDSSGISVSLSSDGNTLAIGAPNNDGNDGNSSNAGHVRVYDWNAVSVSWAKRGSDIDGEATDDLSGISVSLSSDGNTVAIGATRNDGAGENAGHVRVYDWNAVSVSWAKRGSDIDGEAADDQSGQSVSLSSDGNTVAIGAMWNSGSFSSAGHVRVYYWNTAITPNRWSQRGSDIDGESDYDNIGRSVSLSSDGNTVAIGAPNYSGDGSYAGHVRVYDWNGASWAKRGLDIDGEGQYDSSGYSVSLSSDGNTVAIGAYSNDGNDGNRWDSGHVRVYTYQ